MIAKSLNPSIPQYVRTGFISFTNHPTTEMITGNVKITFATHHSPKIPPTFTLDLCQS